MASLGITVRSLREGMGLTQLDLASKSHLGMNFVWAIENDKAVDCTAWQIERLAKTLRVTEGHLLALVPPDRRRVGGGGRAA